MAESGTVYLVGAGPGDPELITAKGLRLLREADVIIYDRLVDRRLLAEAAIGAEIVDARAGARERTAQQGAINSLLVARAQEGKRVVRLKGGDPFLFGRGGEEADVLAAAGIPFEVVPGVSSALAVPAYAGIPVTDRRFSSSLRIMAGHSDDSKDGNVPVVGQSETVVALMVVEALPEIVAMLLAEGWSTATPLVLIERGTTVRQRTLETTLEGAVETAKVAGLQPPAIAVIGNVVRLRERIAWFEEGSPGHGDAPARAASLHTLSSDANQTPNNSEQR